MKIAELPNCPRWLADAKTTNADVHYDRFGRVIWDDGEFRGGAFRGGEFLGEPCRQNPISVYGLKWPVTIGPTIMHIGCERYKFAEWAEFDDARIVKMDRGALKFWRAHKTMLMAMCETSMAR